MINGIGTAIKIILIGLLTIGLYGAASVSYTTITGSAPCPTVGFIPACFIVFIGYLLMLVAIVMVSRRRLRWLFFAAWMPVFLLAFIGSVFEIANGATCPKSNAGLALCYVSLGFAVVVAVLYVFLIRCRRMVGS